MKRFFVVLLFVSLLCSCSNLISHKGNEIQWEDNLGNSIYFSWDIFGDAAVNQGDSSHGFLDRILHHSHVITITGNSYRLKDCVALAE